MPSNIGAAPSTTDRITLLSVTTWRCSYHFHDLKMFISCGTEQLLLNMCTVFQRTVCTSNPPGAPSVEQSPGAGGNEVFDNSDCWQTRRFMSAWANLRFLAFPRWHHQVHKGAANLYAPCNLLLAGLPVTAKWCDNNVMRIAGAFTSAFVSSLACLWWKRIESETRFVLVQIFLHQ